MSVTTTIVAVAASQAARRGAVTAGAGLVAGRAVGFTASRAVQSAEGPIEQAAEEAVGQELTAGDVPGVGADVTRSLGGLF